MSKEVIALIFMGKKTIESRFSQKRIVPFGAVEIGDKVYLKSPGGDIKGQFKASKVIYFAGLEKDDWELIRSKYGPQISLGDSEQDEQFFKKHKTAKFATLIFITAVEQFITSPIKIEKKDLRGWMVLG